MGVITVTATIPTNTEVTANCSPWYRGAGGVIDEINCYLAYQMTHVPSLAAAYDNNSPTLGSDFDLSPGAAPTWSEDYLTFDGADYLITPGLPFVPSVRFSGNTSSCFVYVSNVTKTLEYEGWVIGFHNTDGTSWGIATNGENVCFHNQDYYLGHGYPELLSGVIGFSGADMYANGVYAATMSGGGAMNNHFIEVGRDAAGESNYFTGRIHAIAVYNIKLTAAQVAALYISMSALGHGSD